MPYTCEITLPVRIGSNFLLGGGDLQDIFRVGEVLQVDFTVTIDKNHGCKKIF